MTVSLMYGSPGDSPDMFHAIPTGILDPFLYIEADGRRGATVTMLDAHKVSPLIPGVSVRTLPLATARAATVSWS